MTDAANWPERISTNAKDTFLNAGNLAALSAAGGISIAMHQDADEKIAGHFDEHANLDGFTDESLNVIGWPGTHVAAAALWYVNSARNQDQFNKQRALTLMTALSLNNLTTLGLKAVRHNDTPNGNNWSWPSAHTSSSFTVASVLDEFYGPKVGIPAYALAGIVAYRMMDAGDHWASDVVFGATLGWVVGHTVAGRHKQLEVAGFSVAPFSCAESGYAMGVCLIKQF